MTRQRSKNLKATNSLRDLTSAGVSGQVNSGLSGVQGAQSMNAGQPFSGEQILRNESQRGINQLQMQGMDAVNSVLSATSPSAISAGGGG